MSSSHGHRNGTERSGRGRNVGAKRAEILAAATERFGRDGYEDTKWADIAADVGVGPTALYHYFESKQHCLFVIMADAIEDFHARFNRIVAGERDHVRVLQRVLADAFEVSSLDVQRLRVIVAEQGLLAHRRTSPREEQAREIARERTRDLEIAWATFLSRAMEHGAVPEGDARLLARAALGLFNSIWGWYRPDGVVPLDFVSAFFTERLLQMLGVDPDAIAHVLAA